jgi:hypothetical protein
MSLFLGSVVELVNARPYGVTVLAIKRERTVVVPDTTWQQLRDSIPTLSFAYCFRGQANSTWPLQTSLERAIATHGKPRMPGIYEQLMLHHFKSRAHLYSPHAPDQDDNIEWLAVMQHYGSPTRLLDFTESAYLATYFAVHDAFNPAAVWAIDLIALRRELEQQSELSEVHPGDYVDLRYLKLANRFIANDGENARLSVLPLTPKRLSDRIARQQGLFLMLTNAMHSFEDNLASAYGFKASVQDAVTECTPKDFRKINLNDGNSRPPVIKFVLSRPEQNEALTDLTRMNINAETLFGGLDGLARSLAQTIIRQSA